MKGKIVSYNSSNGIGKILIPNKGVKLFNIDEWLDYNSLPEIGLEVEFEFKDNKIFNILAFNNVNSLFDELNKNYPYRFPNLAIKEDMKLNICTKEFFDNFKKIILKYKYLIDIKKTLPYKKIKRFIFTAYNNLLEIDANINDSKLREIKSSLDEVEYFYDKLQIEMKNPIYVLLEKLVLNKQKSYLELKEKVERNKNLITENSATLNILEVKIKKLETNISTLKQKSEIYKESVEKLKFYKRKYVDLIDSTQNLKEENSSIIENITTFEKVYQNIFEKFFVKETIVISKILEKEMDILAYQFDTILWENAKNSVDVNKFFEESKIEGNYSTKTFMKYYLKTLKNEKMNKKDAELVTIFNELQAFSKNIIVFDKNHNKAREILFYIENIDHDNNVQIFDNLKDFIFYIKEHDTDVDIVIINMEDNTIKLLIKKILPILEKIGAKIITFTDKNLLYKELKEVI